MGCNNTKTAPSNMGLMNSNVETTIRRVQRTWPTINKIDNLGPTAFAHLLYIYPLLKRYSDVSPTLKTEADLLRAVQVRKLGSMLITIYSKIIKKANVNLDESIRNQATVLKKQGIKPCVIEHFGESLYYIATHQINIKLTQREKQSWENFLSYVSNQLITEMALEINNEF